MQNYRKKGNREHEYLQRQKEYTIWFKGNTPFALKCGTPLLVVKEVR